MQFLLSTFMLNPESYLDKIINNGGTLWVMGLKTEGTGVVVNTLGGGKTELLGGMIYHNGPAKTMPMFINNESTVSLSVSGYGAGNEVYNDVVVETRNGVTDTLTAAQVPGRDSAPTLPLYVGGPVPVVTQVAAPAGIAASAAAGLQAYPNPSAPGRATLSLVAQRAQQVGVSVYTMQGRLVQQFPVLVRPGRTDLRFPFALSAGIYYLQATVDGQPQQFTIKVE